MLCTPAAESWRDGGPVPWSVLGPPGSATSGSTPGLLPPALPPSGSRGSAHRSPEAAGPPTHLRVLGDPVAQHVEDAVGGRPADHELLIPVPLVGGEAWGSVAHRTQDHEDEGQLALTSAQRWVWASPAVPQGCGAGLQWVITGWTCSLGAGQGAWTPDGPVDTVPTPTSTSLHLSGAAGGSEQNPCVDGEEGDRAPRAGLEDGYKCARSTGPSGREGAPGGGSAPARPGAARAGGILGSCVFAASHPG